MVIEGLNKVLWKAYLFAYWLGDNWKQRRPPKVVALVLDPKDCAFAPYSSSSLANSSSEDLDVGVCPDIGLGGSPLM